MRIEVGVETEHGTIKLTLCGEGWHGATRASLEEPGESAGHDDCWVEVPAQRLSATAEAIEQLDEAARDERTDSIAEARADAQALS